jgi:hypothetical protein
MYSRRTYPALGRVVRSHVALFRCSVSRCSVSRCSVFRCSGVQEFRLWESGNLQRQQAQDEAEASPCAKSIGSSMPCWHANMRMCRSIVVWVQGLLLRNETGHAVTSPLPHEMSGNDTAGEVRPATRIWNPGWLASLVHGPVNAADEVARVRYGAVPGISRIEPTSTDHESARVSEHDFHLFASTFGALPTSTWAKHTVLQCTAPTRPCPMHRGTFGSWNPFRAARKHSSEYRSRELNATAETGEAASRPSRVPSTASRAPRAECSMHEFRALGALACGVAMSMGTHRRGRAARAYWVLDRNGGD